MATSNDDQTKEEQLVLKAVAPSDDTPQFDQSLILKKMIDPKSGFYCLARTPDNGQHWYPEFTTLGKVYRQTDAHYLVPYLQQEPFDKILMRSPNKAVFSFTVSDDGELQITKVADPPEKAGDDK